MRLPAYPTVVDDVRALFAEPPLADSTLAIDETGVGRPVCDMFRKGGIRATMRPFSITCGTAQTFDRVAKVVLVSQVQAALQSGRLRFAEELELGPTLRKELESFQATMDERTRNESFAADTRAGAHDDLVLALALAVHTANQGEWVMAGYL